MCTNMEVCVKSNKNKNTVPLLHEIYIYTRFHMTRMSEMLHSLGLEISVYKLQCFMDCSFVSLEMPALKFLYRILA